MFSNIRLCALCALTNKSRPENGKAHVGALLGSIKFRSSRINVVLAAPCSPISTKIG